jgi:hypothetical protein
MAATMPETAFPYQASLKWLHSSVSKTFTRNALFQMISQEQF